jgi:hypothetical protein
VRNSCVEKSNVLILLEKERDLDCMYSSRSLELFRMHPYNINLLEFFIDNLFVMFGGCVFQQTVGIPIGTNCAPLLADLFLFLYSYEADFIQGLLKKKRKEATCSPIP